MQSFQIVLTVLVLFVAAAFCSEQEVTQQDAQKTTDKLKLQELLMLLNPKLDGDDLDGSIYQNGGQQPGLGESDEEMGKLGDEDDQDDQDSKYDEKRSGGGAYLRFGKRNPAYLRFGRSNPYLRFGKRLPNGNPAFLRFGKRNPAYLRFGK